MVEEIEISNEYINVLNIKLGILVEFIRKTMSDNYTIYGKKPVKKGMLSPLFVITCNEETFYFLCTGDTDTSIDLKNV